MASPRDLRLQVILQAVDKAVAPLRGITAASSKTAQALKAARDELKGLNAQQGAVERFRQLQGAMQSTSAQAKAVRARIEELRNAQASDAGEAKAHARELVAAEKSLAKLNKTSAEQSTQLRAMRAELQRLGIRNVAADEQRLQGAIQATTASIAKQKAQLDQLAATQRRMAAARAAYDKTQKTAGNLAGAGAATGAAGAAVAVPIMAAVNAYSEQEDATTQLRVAMMKKSGEVGADFQRVNDLAVKLGDKLPGTTSDFIEMMTMLQRQGMSSKAILGGVGEAAAYLGVQLKMPVAEAAEFAAKMQDATRTPEGDMLGLMDQIQKSFYLGVDKNNMLQAVTKMSPAFGILRKEGLAAMQDLMPLAVMMDQTGMAGEAAGNAIRKVFQFSVDAEKREKANKELKGYKAGFKLDFSDGKGEFGGLEKLFQQLEKLKTLNSEQRGAVIKKLFGDDAETLQVVNTLMSKGLDGYNEVAQKMGAQADLRTRVDQQLGTLKNLGEAASGTFTNVLAAIAETSAPDIKQLVTGLGEIAGGIGAWVRENPGLVAVLFKTAAVVAIVLAAMAGLTLALAALLGPFAMVRYGMALLPVLGPAVASVIGGVAAALKGLALAAATNPFLLTVAALGTAAMLLYTNWDAVVAWMDQLPARLAQLPAQFVTLGGEIMQGLINGISSRLQAVGDTVREVASTAVGMFKDTLGIRSPSRVFIAAGSEISAGAAVGIEGRLGLVRRAALGVATAAASALPLATSAADDGLLRIDRRPPLAAAAGGSPATAGGSTYNITINAQAGQDAQAIARAVAAELDRRERAGAARGRSSLRDIE